MGCRSRCLWRFGSLRRFFKYQVFELCEEPEEKEEESGKSYLIPYMMNDAIEDYLVLENCRMVGEVAVEEQAGGLETVCEDFRERGRLCTCCAAEELASWGGNGVYTAF